MKRSVFILFLFIGLSSFSQSFETYVDGEFVFDETQLTIDNAGEDFSSSLESESTVYITVLFGNWWDKHFNKNQKWAVDVKKSDETWNDDLVLEIKRSGKGYQINKPNKKGKVNGGNNFSRVQNISNHFFNGKAEVGDIPINLKLSGISIVHGAKTFETNLILTVYER